LSGHDSHDDIVPKLAQAFEAFNRSADRLSTAYKEMRYRKGHGDEGKREPGEGQCFFPSPCPGVPASSCGLAPDITPMLTAIGDIIMNIAHRMRSPLSAIQLFAELLKQDLSEDKQEMVDDILVGVHSLDAVLNNLLSFAQPVNPRFQEVDLVAVLEESLFFAAPAIKQQGISLVEEYSHDRLCCLGDLEQLKQVCFNLILNAIQAMPEGGELRITAKTTAENYVNVGIEDNGCGIADEFMNRIFTPFYTTKEGGTGLGLCVVYRIVKAHQGSVQVNSMDGCGTNVSIQLPAEQRMQQVALDG
jgi:signal transduction histidine kinase